MASNKKKPSLLKPYIEGLDQELLEDVAAKIKKINRKTNQFAPGTTAGDAPNSAPRTAADTALNNLSPPVTTSVDAVADASGTTPVSAPDATPVTTAVTTPDTTDENNQMDPVFRSYIHIRLSDKRYAFYLCLMKLEGHPVNLNIISKELNIPYPTLRTNVQDFRKLKIIISSKPCRYGNVSASFIELNKRLKVELNDQNNTYSKIALKTDVKDLMINKYTDLGTAPVTTPGTTAVATVHVSSSQNPTNSSLVSKETTTAFEEGDITYIERELALPVHQYWTEQGVSPHIILSWKDKYRIPLEIIFRSMEHCRWAILENGKQVTSSDVGLLEGSFKQYGQFTKPKGFKSYVEQQLDNAKKISEEREKLYQELRRTNEENASRELRIYFEQVFADHECDLHKQCRSMLNPIMRDPKIARLQPDQYKDSMWEAFKRITAETSQIPTEEITG